MLFFCDDNPDGRTVHVYVDEQEVPIEFLTTENADVRRRYLRYHMNFVQEITGKISLKKGFNQKIKIMSCFNEQETEVYSLSGKQLSELRNRLDGNLEMERIEDGKSIFAGWAASKGKVQLSVQAHGKHVPCEVIRKCRKDVAECYGELESGYEVRYEIEISDKGCNKLNLIMEAEEKQDSIKVFVNNIRAGKSGHGSVSIFEKAWDITGAMV